MDLNNGMHVTGLGNAERGVSLVWEPGVCSDREWEYFVLLVILVGIFSNISDRGWNI